METTPPTLNYYNMCRIKIFLNKNDEVVVYIRLLIEATSTVPNCVEGNYFIVNIGVTEYYLYLSHSLIQKTYYFL